MEGERIKGDGRGWKDGRVEGERIKGDGRGWKDGRVEGERISGEGGGFGFRTWAQGWRVRVKGLGSRMMG